MGHFRYKAALRVWTSSTIILPTTMFMQTEAVQFYQILIVRMLQNQLEGERSKGKLETEMCDADLWGVIEVKTGGR